MKQITTLESVAKTLGANGFKNYAKDYGNSRVTVEHSVSDAINLLESYRDDEKLIAHFNCFRREMSEKYSSNSVPFYKTDAFKEQCEQERREFGCFIN